MIMVVIETRTTATKLTTLPVKRNGKATIITDMKIRFDKQRGLISSVGRDATSREPSGLMTNEYNEVRVNHKSTGYPRVVNAMYSNNRGTSGATVSADTPTLYGVAFS